MAVKKQEIQTDSFVNQITNDFRALKINDLMPNQNNKPLHAFQDYEEKEASYAKDDTLHLSFDLLEVKLRRAQQKRNCQQELEEIVPNKENKRKFADEKKTTLIETIGQTNLKSSARASRKTKVSRKTTDAKQVKTNHKTPEKHTEKLSKFQHKLKSETPSKGSSISSKSRKKSDNHEEEKTSPPFKYLQHRMTLSSLE